MPNFTLAQLAKFIDARIQGDENCSVSNIAAIEVAQPGELTFITSGQYSKYLVKTTASAVVLSEDHLGACALPALIVANPKLSLAQLVPLFYPPQRPNPGIHPSAVIGNHCHIAENASIGAHCVIADKVCIGENSVIEGGTVLGPQVVIGDNCHLAANVTIYHDVKLGRCVIIHSGTVIGADGFGYANDDGHWIKIPQVGTVIIGDDVEIGANSTVDRGTLSDTQIGNGVKIDNQVQIGHNVIIGEHTIIAGCTGIAGSTRIGAYCMIGGGACIGDHLDITDHVVIGGMGAVGQSVLEPGVYSSGIGILKNKEWRRNMLRFQQLDQMAKRIRKLEQINQSD